MTNPARDVRPPAPSARDLTIPSDELIGQVIGALDGWVAVAVRVLAATGMRRGELIALKWKDVDLDEGVITIRAAAVAATGVRTIKSTKTASSVRTIHIDPGTIEILREHQRLHPGETYLFTAPNGEPYRPDSLTQAFGRQIGAAGITEPITLRDLRHASVTRLLLAGVDVRTVAGRHGHARSSTTLDRYAAFMPAADKAAADVVGAAFDGLS